jgi:lipoic acid synthetase
MVGLGETKQEVLQVMDDMRDAQIDVMTIGQYLRPSDNQIPVRAFITPEEFKDYELEGMKRGFKFVESGPFVRSSYHAWKHTADVPQRVD